MLNGIHIVDFANHRDTELRFGAFTALVGQNGAGKTNVMRAIMEFSKAMDLEKREIVNLRQFVRTVENFPKLAAGWSGRFRDTEGDFGGEIRTWGNTWYWRTRLSDRDLPWIPGFQPNPSRTILGKRHPSIRMDEDSDFRPGHPTEIDDAPLFLGLQGCKSNYFKLTGERLREPSYTEVNPPTLLENGSEFAWTLAYLMTAKPECFREILNALRDIVPTVKNVRAQPVRISRVEHKTMTINKQERTYQEEQVVMGQELIFDMVSGEGLPATSVSDGTLIVLAVLTATIHGALDSNIVLMDDIEQGLHPKAQRDLIRQLRKLQEVRPELQIIVSSHSPYVVDELSPEDVWLFAPDKEGCAAYARLSDHPDVDRALKVLTTGEFWSSEGEEWVLDPKKRTNRRKKQLVA